VAQYQKVEYIIGKDGKITETVIGASGSSCTQTTKEIEGALGKIDSRELLSEYYETEENLSTSETQYLNERD
jgi:Protein of unknown function (DUF2997)